MTSGQPVVCGCEEERVTRAAAGCGTVAQISSRRLPQRRSDSAGVRNGRILRSAREGATRRKAHVGAKSWGVECRETGWWAMAWCLFCQYEDGHARFRQRAVFSRQMEVECLWWLGFQSVSAACSSGRLHNNAQRDVGSLARTCVGSSRRPKQRVVHSPSPTASGRQDLRGVEKAREDAVLCFGLGGWKARGRRRPNWCVGRCSTPGQHSRPSISLPCCPLPILTPASGRCPGSPSRSRMSNVA